MVGAALYTGLPMRFAGYESSVSRAAPLLGQDNDHVLADLGHSTDDRRQLAVMGDLNATSAARRVSSTGPRRGPRRYPSGTLPGGPRRRGDPCRVDPALSATHSWADRKAESGTGHGIDTTCRRIPESGARRAAVEPSSLVHATARNKRSMTVDLQRPPAPRLSNA